jgi:putative membrane protein
MKKNLLVAGLLFSAVYLVACGNSEGDGTDISTSTTTTSTDTANNMGTAATATMAVGDTDRQFIMEAASGGMMEVEAGRLAEQNAQNARVKAFGAMMVRDHTAANNELMAIASARNVTVPDSMTAKHKTHLDKLRTATGRAFDREYMSMMVMAHNEDINKFQVASNNAQDTAVRGFATRTLPILRMHKDSATAINGNLR